jgi:hypothetical protein
MLVLSLQVLECDAVSADKVPTETTLDALATAPTALVLKWKHPASCGDKCSSHFEQYRITATLLDKVEKNGDQFLIERVFFLLIATDVSSLVVDSSTSHRFDFRSQVLLASASLQSQACIRAQATERND